MKKKLVIITSIILLALLSNYFIKREVHFTMFTEDSSNNDVSTEIFVDDELLYKGKVGYQMFGFKGAKKKLSGGFHSVEIVSNDKIVKKTVFVLPNDFTITWWDTQKPEIKINFYFTPFYFE